MHRSVQLYSYSALPVLHVARVYMLHALVRTAVASSAVFFRPYTRCLPAVNSAPQLSQIKKLWDLLVDLSYC
jgi:hypothetical protein